MNLNYRTMLKQVRGSLRELDKAKKIHSELLDGVLKKLPPDKRKEASILIKKARKGDLDLSEMMAFVGKVSPAAEEKIKSSVNGANAKKEEVTGK